MDIGSKRTLKLLFNIDNYRLYSNNKKKLTTFCHTCDRTRRCLYGLSTATPTHELRKSTHEGFIEESKDRKSHSSFLKWLMTIITNTNITDTFLLLLSWSEYIQRIHRSVCTFLTSLRDDWKIFLPRCKHIYNTNNNKLERKFDWNKYTIVHMVLTSSSSLPAVANVYLKLKDLISVQSKFSATQKEQRITSWNGSLGWSMIIKK